MSAIIQTHGLSRQFSAGGETVAALESVDLEVAQGEFVALVGPSGSGKSTLLNIIGALDRPSRGKITVDGLSLGDATEQQRVRHRRERIGFIFQSFNLLPALTAVENVEAPMMLADVSKQERRKRAMDLLKSVGLEHRARHTPSQLSGGERQRIAITRALANHPALLLADEPTGNLDSRTGAAILEMLCSRLRQERLTLVLVTHDMQIAARADRIIHLQDGRVHKTETRRESTNPEKLDGAS
jgi:putative ABC transport system ATP-binding protein